jgi:phosphoglycerate dehydrogenase-like enzyme
MMVRIGVTSISFSKNAELCRIASEIFPEVRFNAQGLVRSEDDVISFLQSCDGAIVGTEPVSERVLDALPDLQMIAKYGVGLDSIDLEAMARRGIALGWTGGVNRRSVSELALCLMLMLSRNVSRTSAALARGSWQKDGGRLLSGRSIGIVGCGFVGRICSNFSHPWAAPGGSVTSRTGVPLLSGLGPARFLTRSSYKTQMWLVFTSL